MIYRHYHEWFPDLEPREFIPITQVCIKGGCTKTNILKPTGQCLGGHPIAEHYNSQGRRIDREGCAEPW